MIVQRSNREARFAFTPHAQQDPAAWRLPYPATVKKGGFHGYPANDFVWSIVGAIAKFLMPGNDPGGIIVTIILGILGSLLGGFLFNSLGLGGAALRRMDRLNYRSHHPGFHLPADSLTPSSALTCNRDDPAVSGTRWATICGHVSVSLLSSACRDAITSGGWVV